MKQLHVLVAVPHYPPAIGGVEGYSHAVVAELKRKGHKVTVITTKLANTTTTEAADKKNSVIRLTPWIRFSNTPLSPLWYFQIKRVIKITRPDVIHVHSPVPLFADITVLAAGKRVPILMTYHAGSMKKGNSVIDTIISFYEKHLLPKVFRRVSKIGAVLPSFVQQYVDNPSDVEFTPPGIDTDLFKPNARTRRTTDIIFVGRIEATSGWKGLDVFLQAITLVKKKKPNVTVQIVGQGDAIGFYRQLVKELSLDKNVAFITDRRGKQMVSIYQTAKMIVLPSKTEAESFGMVLAEAMACGVAPIGSHIGGIPNVIQHEETGLLVPPNDSKALSEGILKLLTQPKYRQQLADKAELSIEEKFTLSKMTETNINLLYAIARKEIVHISAYYPPHLGGMELAIRMLTNKLYDNARRISVVTSTIGGKADGLLFASPFPVTRLWAFVAANTPIIPGLLWKLLRCSSHSIFHVHVAQAGIPEVAFLAAKIKRIPIILHLHADVEASSAVGFLLPLYKKLFLGFILRRAQAVIVPTETYKKTMIKRYKLKNAVHVVPAGIDERFFLTDYKKPSKKRFTVLYVGRLTVEKNVDLLIEAMQKVGYPVHFNIVGDGLLRHTLEERVAHEDSAQRCTITFVGRKFSNELTPYYQKADALVLASDYESQSLVVLEAMAAGTPVIVADVPGVNEIVGDAGILTEKTVDAFSAAVTYLIENPTQRIVLAKKGKERAKEFSWDILIRKFEDIYDALEK